MPTYTIMGAPRSASHASKAAPPTPARFAPATGNRLWTRKRRGFAASITSGPTDRSAAIEVRMSARTSGGGRSNSVHHEAISATSDAGRGGRQCATFNANKTDSRSLPPKPAARRRFSASRTLWCRVPSGHLFCRCLGTEDSLSAANRPFAYQRRSKTRSRGAPRIGIRSARHRDSIFGGCMRCAGHERVHDICLYRIISWLYNYYTERPRRFETQVENSICPRSAPCNPRMRRAVALLRLRCKLLITARGACMPPVLTCTCTSPNTQLGGAAAHD